MVPAPNFIFTIGMPLNSVKVHWGDVTMLTMHSLHIDECVELFRQSTKLHTCNFSYIQPALVNTPIPEERVWLPNLKVLLPFNLSRNRSESARLLDYITASSLALLSAATESEGFCRPIRRTRVRDVFMAGYHVSSMAILSSGSDNTKPRLWLALAPNLGQKISLIFAANWIYFNVFTVMFGEISSSPNSHHCFL